MRAATLPMYESVSYTIEAVNKYSFNQPYITELSVGWSDVTSLLYNLLKKCTFFAWQVFWCISFVISLMLRYLITIILHTISKVLVSGCLQVCDVFIHITSHSPPTAKDAGWDAAWLMCLRKSFNLRHRSITSVYSYSVNLYLATVHECLGDKSKSPCI